MGQGRRTVWLALLLALAVLAEAAFLSLGVWQIQRLHWKQALIEQVDRQLKADPTEAPGPAHWSALSRSRDDYRRITAAGEFTPPLQVLVRAATELGSGYWVLSPLLTRDDTWVLVNRGFVPPEMKDRIPPPPPQAQVTGLLRMSEPGGSVLQANVPAQGRWYSRDVAAIAAHLQLRGPVAPYFIDVQAIPKTATATAAAWPRPGLTVVRFANNHLPYALTWFAMAAIMPAMIVIAVVRERRRTATPAP